jgi:Annexin
MKWLGTNEKAIISVLCTKPDNQRQAIAQSFKEVKGKVRTGFD